MFGGQMGWNRVSCPRNRGFGGETVRVQVVDLA